MKQYHMGDVPMFIWPNIVRWMIDTFEPSSWYLIDDYILETTEENFMLLCLRWA